MACLIAAAIWNALRPGLMHAPYPHPHVVALLHLWLPGFLATVSLGAVYQLMPVILGAKLAHSRLAWTHLGVHAAGLLLLVPGLANGRYLAVAIGGVLIAAGGGMLLVVVLRTYRASTRRDAIATCFPLAASWLLATFLAGIILAANRHHPWIPVSILSLLGAHAHLGMAGFFVTLLQGATFQLVPMFTLGETRQQGRIAIGLALGQMGLILLVVGLANESSLFTRAGTIVVMLGLGASARALFATLATRRRRVLELPLKAFCLGLGLLALAAAFGAWSRFSGDGHWTSLAAVQRYGLLLVPGALALAIMGMLLKIVPFLTWMHAYGPLVGRQPVPRATELSTRRLEKIWLSLHVTALAIGALGTFSLLPATTQFVAPLLLSLGAAVFVTNLGRVMLHLRSSAAPRPAVTTS